MEIYQRFIRLNVFTLKTKQKKHSMTAVCFPVKALVMKYAKFEESSEHHFTLILFLFPLLGKCILRDGMVQHINCFRSSCSTTFSHFGVNPMQAA